MAAARCIDTITIKYKFHIKGHKMKDEAWGGTFIQSAEME